MAATATRAARTSNNGLLQVGNSNALGSGALAANGGTLDLTGYSVTVASFSGAAGTVTNNGGSLATLNVTQNGDTSFGGTIQDGTQPLALTLTGTGGPGLGLVLTGVSSYSGTTTLANILPDNNTVSGSDYHAMLSLYGRLTNSPVAIQSGVLLLGGTIDQSVTMTGGGIDDLGGTPLISGSLTVTRGVAKWYTALTTVAGGVSVQGGQFIIGAGSKLNAPSVTINGGMLTTAGAYVLSATSAVTVNGGTLDVSGNAQSIQSLSVGSLGTLNLGVGNLLSVSGSAGLAGTLDIIGSNSITSLPYALMTYSGSPTGTFGNVVGLPSTDKLSYGSGTLDIVASVNAPELCLDGHGRGAQDHRRRFDRRERDPDQRGRRPVARQHQLQRFVEP